MEYGEKGGSGRGGDRGLAALKEQYRHLPKIEVDEVARLMGHVRSEIPSDDAVPCRVIFFVKFLLDICSNILENKLPYETPKCMSQIFRNIRWVRAYSLTKFKNYTKFPQLTKTLHLIHWPRFGVILHYPQGIKFDAFSVQNYDLIY